MSIKCLNNDPIDFCEESHTYHHQVTGKQYISVSKFIELFSEKFNREGISYAVAKKAGVSQEEVLSDWDKKRDDSIDHGNRIHNALEKYERSTVIDADNNDLAPMIKSVTSLYTGYYRIYQEQRLRNDEYLICGTADKLMQCTSSSKSVISLADYKTNQRKGIQYKSDYNKYLLGPLSHLQDCNFVKYSLQLSIYAYMASSLTGLKIQDLHILYIPADNYMNYQKIPVSYMKSDVINMLDWYKSNVLNKEIKPTFELEPSFGDENFIFGE